MTASTLARRAFELWRREGLGSVIRRARRRWRGWRPDTELLAGLDAPLPDALAVGEGTVLSISGWCFHPSARARRLELVVNGRPHSVAAMRLPRPDVLAAHFPERDPRGHGHASGFTAMVPFAPDEAGVSADVFMDAWLDDGSRCSRSLGRIRLDRERAAAGEAVPAARIAICMATCNPPPALFEAQVRSMREQTVTDWVCLVSDDASDPEALDAIRRITGEDARFHLIEWPERAGFYANFERCLSMVPAGTEYVALSDHDDRWHPGKLEALLAAFHPDTTLVYSDMNVIDEQGKVLSTTYWTTRPNRYDDLASLLIANTVTGAASLFRASLLRRLLPFPQPVAAPFHDHWLACVALATGRVRYVDRPLYDYVQHAGNVLGHYAPAGTSVWADARSQLGKLSREGAGRIRSVLGRWQAVYYGELQKVKLMARVLDLRCAGALTPDKARAVRRLAALDESWATATWLAGRGVKGMGRVTETLGGERTLLRGVVWGLFARVRTRFLPRGLGGGRAGDAATGRSGILERVQQIEEKIAPLRLRISPAAPARVNLLIPTIDFTYFFGGYIAKFNLARRLADRGHRVRVVAVDYTPDRMATWRQQVRAFEGLDGVFDRVEVALAADRSRALEVSPRDTFVATTWWTAHIAHRATASLAGKRFLYLVQEYEPFTFPMGAFAALARESYDFPHLAVFSTELLRDYFRRNRIGVFAEGHEAGDRDSISFQNAITPVGPVSVDDIAGRRPPRLLFYARPEAHAARNMFEVGMLGLSRAIADGCFDRDWEFHGLGAVGAARSLPLGGGASLRLHPRLTQAEYRGVLRSHDLGLSLMYTPHPSLVPLEMASAGMLVVTNSFENKTPGRLAEISSNMVVVEPTVDGVVRGLREASSAAGDYDRRARGSRVAWSTDWSSSFDDRVMDAICEFLARTQAFREAGHTAASPAGRE